MPSRSTAILSALVLVLLLTPFTNALLRGQPMKMDFFTLSIVSNAITDTGIELFCSNGCDGYPGCAFGDTTFVLSNGTSAWRNCTVSDPYCTLTPPTSCSYHHLPP